MGEWKPIETAPRDVKLIVAYRNGLGKWRTVLAKYYSAKTLMASEDFISEGEDDDGFAPEGWYEESESYDELLPCDAAPTHWQPLPEPPK